jgi:sortase A
MSRVRRRLGTTLIVLGVLALGYGAAVYFWKDPVTGLYTSWKQHQLDDQLEEAFADFRADEGISLQPVAAPAEPVTTGESAPAESEAQTETTGELAADTETPAELMAAETRAAAEQFLKKIKPGQPLGRIIIPKIDVNLVFVNGTSSGDLKKGPGRYPETSVPGLGQLTAIAGHRTTFGAPFRNIDDLVKGNEIVLQLPYGTFTYRVIGREIVDDEDWSVIDPRGFDTLVLSACHPLYSAEQRWIVYAKLMKVRMPDGESYREPAAVASG